MTQHFISLVPKEPLFSKTEFDRMSSICENIGIVLFASVIVPYVFGIEGLTTVDVVLALLGTLYSWLISIFLARKSGEV